MNRKKIAAIVLFGLTMTTCAEPATGQMYGNLKYLSEPQKTQIFNMVKEAEIKQAAAEAEAARLKEIEDNTAAMQKALKKLNKTVGRTWYVFSGSTPSGWDCSGLTLWFYEELGIDLKHRASEQDSVGEKTSDPKPGDIVVFKYKGYTQAYHVGIYIGNNKMIHAPRKGEVTRIEDIDQFGGGYSKISFRQLIETL